ncbi:NAD(P)-dependent dehydrogenase (short-subunit alcohol dehydrogenase family) [Catenuloplanes nepalensis]|uniref:NAD(P)-dependent dehydrogenase (Short-subunit alcohol dehydrogenase family) n=1 Tax=Catenuloplanes nepalensis TaxID=587533 RepID=A0ABT9MRY7_9ACTN|nr:SDR family NAD(P)-dependent oxidoreductase [Catenuloplanes nepalensis]MDP9794158.1 NAD(P)-dependent dehydrogenase (short-subunit alcohol dehydrogenase family) [Catenuloplanes nepalensis]
MPPATRAVVTGATSGIGEAIARRLAADGVHVTLVGRDDARLDQTRRRILAGVPDAGLHPERADLSLLGEVRDLAGRLADSPPDIVICNAAVVADAADRTPEGHQRALATNHLAPYLLLRSLVKPIGSRTARFVVVGGSPGGLARMPIDVDDLDRNTSHDLGPAPSLRAFVGYARTKNMNAMFVYALARRLHGTRITVNGAHPGIIRGTRLGLAHQRGLNRAFGTISQLLFSPGGPDAGADTPAWLASAPEVDGITGRFFVKRRPVTTAPHTTDAARCDRLWAESARLVGEPVTL